MELCPQCRRRLLSQASACCNWCGHVIEDAAYQARAEQERLAYFAEMAARDALDHLRLDGGPDALAAAQIAQAKMRSRMPPLIAARPETKPAPPPVKEPETDTGDRFQHLEL